MKVEVSQYVAATEAGSNYDGARFVFKDPPVLAEVVHWHMQVMTDALGQTWPETWAVIAYLPCEWSGDTEQFGFETVHPSRLRVRYPLKAEASS